METFESLYELKYNTLRSLAKKQGLKANGTRTELIVRILDTADAAKATIELGEEGVDGYSTHTNPAKPLETVATRPSKHHDKPCSVPPGDYTRRKSDRLSPKVKHEDSEVCGSSATASERIPMMGTATKSRQPEVMATRDTPDGVTPSALTRQHPVVSSKVERLKKTPSSRFARAHDSLFAGQPSIEWYGKTPKRTGTTRISTSGTLVSQTCSSSKLAERAPAKSLFYDTDVPVLESSAQTAARAKTTASKRGTLVVKPSKKKPTQVKAFNLSSSKRKREGFTFKPYTGRVRPLNPEVLGTSAPWTSKANLPRPRPSHETSKTASITQAHHRNPAGIKGTLASNKAQVNRRAAHFASAKHQRDKRLQERRTGVSSKISGVDENCSTAPNFV